MSTRRRVNDVHDVHSGIVHNSQQVEATQMSINGRMDKEMWYIHAMEYYSDLKRIKVLIPAKDNMDKP